MTTVHPGAQPRVRRRAIQEIWRREELHRLSDEELRNVAAETVGMLLTICHDLRTHDATAFMRPAISCWFWERTMMNTGWDLVKKLVADFNGEDVGR